jgi:hypothetical protein
MTVSTEFRQSFDPIPGHASRFTAMLRDLTSAELDAVVPGMTWRAEDVARHVLTVLLRYGGSGPRAATRHGLDELNQSELQAVDRSVGEVADAIDESVAQLAEVAPHIPGDQLFEFHLGLTVDVPAAWANLCSEFLVHGSDIARATSRPWSFPVDGVEGIWRNLMPAASGWLRAEAAHVDEVYEIRFPFGPVAVWIHDGAVTTDDAIRPADHTIEVDDPVTFTLGVPWRRALVTDPAAALFLSRFHDI